jgi:hypothetical protein
MANNKEQKEVLEKNLKTKEVYFYIDDNVKCKSREVFKNKRIEIHFPFTREGTQKYKFIDCVIFHNVSPKDIRGVYKDYKRGFGFTRFLSPLVKYLADNCQSVSRIAISSEKKTEMKDFEIVFNRTDLDKLYSQIKPLKEKQSDEMELLVNNVLSEFFPSVSKQDKNYFSGDLARFIQEKKQIENNLSDDDVQAINDVIYSINPEHNFFKKRKILITKEKIDTIYLEDLIKRYKSLLLRKADSKNLEKSWQEFFSDNVLYFNLGYTERFEKERIQGDKKINIPDFMLLDIYGYLDILEIKTHLKQILSFDKGRKNFYWTTEICKAISQVENYIDSIIIEEDRIIKNIRDEYGISVDAVRPLAYIIISSRDYLAGKNTKKYGGKDKVKLWRDFRRLNNSLKNIRIILYDELVDIFENALKRLKNK